MNVARPSQAPVVLPPRRLGVALAAALVALAVMAAFHNSFDGAFVFDDLAGIAENPTIRRLWPLGPVLNPPSDAGTTVGGRPVVNLTLALNYALGGTAVRGYHVVNLAIHLGAALALFGLVRRTLLLPRLRERFGPAATGLAATIATLWAVHPLQTESVTYVIQRAESLVSLFYLLTLYAFVRGVVCHPLDDKRSISPLMPKKICHLMDDKAPPGDRRWLVVAVAACALGMATKEVMATAPLLVLLYDRTFVAGSFSVAFTQRRRWYLGLFATWLVLGALVLSTGNRGGTAGLGAGDSPLSYALTQIVAVTHYLRLAFWPAPLVFDYGTHLTPTAGELAAHAVILLPLLGATVFALWRSPAVGFLGAWFFLILAPSSSVVPIAVQPMAEHRMYLPLAALVALTVLAVYARLGRRSFAGFVLIALVLGALTIRRNDDYRTSLTFWADAVAKRPDNPRALCNYADFVAADGRLDAAIGLYEKAARLERPAAERGDRSLLPGILINLGNALLNSGRDAEAATRYEEALRYDVRSSLAHYNLASVLMEAGRLDEAALHFEAAIRLEPTHVSSHTNLSSVRSRQGRYVEALAEAETALRLEPTAKTHANLGIALLNVKRLPEAVAAFETTLRLQPEFFEAERFLGDTLLALGRRADAATHYRAALRLRSDDAEVRRILSQLEPSGPLIR